MMTTQNRDNLDRLLLVFVHGFRGTDTSFKDFPNRLQTILTNTVKADVDAIVYPSYKTAGDLRIAVENFSTWLCNEVSKIKEEIKRLNSTGKIMIVLLGHSMGGIVSAETILRFYNNTNNCAEQLLGAKIIGMLAFDTPFYSINQNFVADRAWSGVDQVNREVGRLWNAGGAAATVTAATATRAITAGNTGSGGGGKKWGLLAGVVGAAALGAAAYMARDKIQTTISDAYNELTFISDLTDMNGCDQRVKKLLRVPDIFFKCFYVQLSQVGSDQKPRTFIRLPPEEIAYLFVPVQSSADDEIRAHTSMFNPKKTDHYYELGSDSIALITEMVARFQRKQQGHVPINYPYYPPPSTANTSTITPPPAIEKSSSVASDSTAPEQKSNIPYYPPPPPPLP